jgi:hypothetical protein
MYASTQVPGNSSNAVVLLDGPEVPYGLVKLQNVGEYGIAIGAIDANGNRLEPHVYLRPGQSHAGFRPPANAVKIIIMGEKDLEDGISGIAELEYDVPWYS